MEKIAVREPGVCRRYDVRRVGETLTGEVLVRQKGPEYHLGALRISRFFSTWW